MSTGAEIAADPSRPWLMRRWPTLAGLVLAGGMATMIRFGIADTHTIAAPPW